MLNADADFNEQSQNNNYQVSMLPKCNQTTMLQVQNISKPFKPTYLV